MNHEASLRLRPITRAAALLAALSLAAALVGAWRNPAQFAFSWLFAFAFFFTIGAGSLFWVILHHVVDAEWSVVVRRLWEQVAGLFPVLAVLFVPLVFVAPDLWSWMRPENAPAFADVSAYLNRPFFFARAFLVLAVFTVAAALLRAFSIAQDAGGASRYTQLNRRTAGAAVVPFGLALTIAAVDWLMGLDAHWFSAIWGVYIFAGAALAGLCVLVLLVTLLRGALPGLLRPDHFHIMGKLMLAFTMFWAYIAYSQYMLIWYGNIPEETVYFRLRASGSWRMLGVLLVIGHFLIPFLLLLFRGVKNRPAILAAIAAGILLMHLLDVYLVVLPVLHPAGFAPHWLDLSALLAVGGVLAVAFLKSLGRAAIYPCRDPRLARSLALKN